VAVAWTVGRGRLWARERHTWTTSVAGRLREFGDGKQNRRVFECMQRVPRLGNDQEVAVASLPLGGVGNEPYPSPQNLDGRLAGILVLRQHRPRGQRDERLPQHMLMPTVDRLGGAASRSGRCRVHQYARTRLERELLHIASVVTQPLDRQSHVRSALAAACEAASYARCCDQIEFSVTRGLEAGCCRFTHKQRLAAGISKEATQTMRIVAVSNNCQRDLLLSQLVEGPQITGRCHGAGRRDRRAAQWFAMPHRKAGSPSGREA
jgi:ferredoxin-like protein FixX